jgi:replicative DNA helicase
MKPNETYLEKLLFKSIVMDASFLPMVNNKFKAEIFADKSFEEVTRFYKNFYEDKGRVPTLQDVKLLANTENLASHVREAFGNIKGVDHKEIPKEELYDYFENYIKKRLALITFKDIFNKYDPSSDLDSDMLVEKFTNVASIKLIQEDAFDIYRDVEKFIQESRTDNNRLPIGFREIDKVINGGLPSDGKVLCVVSAPTNMGKSIFLANVAVNAAKQGKRVLIISLEMSEIVYAQRVYSDLYNLPINSIPMMTEELRQGVANKQLGNIKIKEFPPSTLTVSELDGYIEQLIRQGERFDLICVDYLTLMNAPRAENSNEAGKMVAREMRALSYKYKCPVFTAAQINREGMSNTPDMKYFAESIAICAEADLIISLYRQEEDLTMGVMRAAILKSRLGAKGMTIPLRFNIENLRFEDLDNAIAAEIEEGSPADAIQGMNSLFN